MNVAPQNILILGATGMLGCALFTALPKLPQGYKVYGTYRSMSALPVADNNAKLIMLEDIFDGGALLKIIGDNDIDVVINAIGLIKQIGHELTQFDFVKVNAWLPHYLSDLCDRAGARFIEISTDCVFTGQKGYYNESDTPDAKDIYGLSKLLGEVTDKPHALTIRTSIIGHESGRAASLIDWFLSQSGDVKGFTKAVFSGFPTTYFAEIIGTYVLPRADLHGLYHVSSKPIDKFKLLSLVARTYSHNVNMIPDGKLVIDRSLDSTKFKHETGFEPPAWPELIEQMKHDRPNWIRNDS